MKTLVFVLIMSICLFGCAGPEVTRTPLVSSGFQLEDTKRSWDEENIYMGKLASRFGSGRSQEKDSIVEVGAAVVARDEREMLEFDIKIINLTGDTAYYGILVTGRSKEQQEELEKLDAIEKKEHEEAEALWKKVKAWEGKQLCELYATDKKQFEERKTAAKKELEKAEARKKELENEIISSNVIKNDPELRALEREILEGVDAAEKEELEMFESIEKGIVYEIDESDKHLFEPIEMDKASIAKRAESLAATNEEREKRRKIALAEQPLRLLSPAEAVYYSWGETSEDALMKAQALASVEMSSGNNPGPVSSQTYGGYTTYNYYGGAVGGFASGFATGFNNAMQWEAIIEMKRAAAIRKSLIKHSQEALPIVGVLLPGMARVGKVWALPTGGPVTLSVATTTDETLKTIQDVHIIHLDKSIEQMHDSIEK